LDRGWGRRNNFAERRVSRASQSSVPCNSKFYEWSYAGGAEII